MKSGLNSWREVYAIKAMPAPEQTAGIASIEGQLIVDYQVASYNDLRNNKTRCAYLISCTQRLIVPNQNNEKPFKVARSHASGYGNYLGALGNSMFPFITTIEPGTKWVPPIHPQPTTDGGPTLLEYIPKTVNTAVMANSNQSASSTQSSGSTVSHSSGSSTSQTNSFDLAINEGFSVGKQGFDITGSSSQSFGHSITREISSELQRARGLTSGRDDQLSESYSMTIKDWGSYACLDYQGQRINWLWGQEFPWNILQINGGFEATPTNFSNDISLPVAVTNTLAPTTSGKQVLLPPSQLSLFGVSFVSKSVWYLPASEAESEEYLAFRHDISGFLASHSLTGTTVSANLSGEYSQTLVSPEPVPLRILALGPLEAEENAVIGFVPGQFIYPPDQSGNFRIRSAQNNLYITGSGFQQERPPTGKNPTDPDTVMTTAEGMSVATPATITVYFKVREKSRDLSLHLKHWRVGAQACVLTISVNGSPPIMRHVDSPETGGGSDNLTVIQLSHLDFASIEYFDYLKVGLNTIAIKIRPSTDGQQSGCQYAIRAIAIS